jgi:hypothetical protein
LLQDALFPVVAAELRAVQPLTLKSALNTWPSTSAWIQVARSLAVRWNLRPPWRRTSSGGCSRWAVVFPALAAPACQAYLLEQMLTDDGIWVRKYWFFSV